MGGKKSTKSAAVTDAICARLSEGETLMSICRSKGMPAWRTVYAWLKADPDFKAAYEEARNLGFDAIAQDVLRIADTPLEGVRTEISKDGIKTVREDMIAHRKLQVWTRLQLLAKWDPKRYGERVQTEHSGDVGLTVQIVRYGDNNPDSQ